MASLIQLRDDNKRRFGKYLKEFAASPPFISLLRSKLGDGYRMVQYKSCYKHQSLQILSYQLSSMGNSSIHKIFQISVADRYLHLSNELDHLSKTGLAQLIVDKNNNVCLFSSVYDHFDQPPAFNSKDKKIIKFNEVLSDAFLKDKTYQKIILESSQKNNIKYGDILHIDKVVVRPDLIGRGLFGFDVAFVLAVFMGYKCEYVLQSHPWSIDVGDKLVKRSEFYNGIIKWKRTSYYDFSNFTFQDGTSILNYYQKAVQKLKENHSTIGILWAFLDASKMSSVSQVIDMWYLSRKTKKIKQRSRL